MRDFHGEENAFLVVIHLFSTVIDLNRSLTRSQTNAMIK